MFGLASPALSLINPCFQMLAIGSVLAVSVVGTTMQPFRETFTLWGATARFATAHIIPNGAVSGKARTSLVVNRVNGALKLPVQAACNFG